MSIEAITKRIQDEAVAAARLAMAEAQEKANAEIAAGQEEASAQAEVVKKDASDLAHSLEDGAKAGVAARRRQILLAKKQELIEAAFERASRALADLPPDKYQELLVSSITSRALGGEKVLLGARDEQVLGAGFAALVNERFLSAGGSDPLEVEFLSQDLGGGYILSSPGVRDDNTFPALVQRYRDELEIEVAATLYPRGE